jgi:UDP-N-acetylmuramoyl-tripeptide--D-alanyl-D-alanine ligase
MRFSLKEAVEITNGNAVKGNADISFSRLCTDTRQDCSDALFIAIAGENFDAHDFLDQAIAANAAALCIDYKHQGKLPADLKIPALLVDETITAYKLLARERKRQIPELKTVAVTGSMGKTSIKEIIRAVLNAAYGENAVLATAGNLNNQIGVPQTLSAITASHQAAVIEAGTNHHGEIEPLSQAIEPDVAVISSIAPCHLEFLGDLNGVATEKSAIFTHLQPDGVAIFPEECPGKDIIIEAAGKFKKLTFGESTQADVRSEYLGGNLHGSRIRLTFPGNKSLETDWPLTGQHQALNAAAAGAVAVALNIPPETVIKGLQQASLPGFRMKISEHHGATWVNDAYNASPGSVTAILQWLAEFTSSENCVLVLGDMLELGEATVAAHQEIISLARKLFPAARIFSIGPIYSTIKAENVINFLDAKSAISAINAAVQPDDTVLLKGSRGMKLEQIEPEA